MPIRGQNWYNLNSHRRYPLDTAATGESDAGRNMPDDVLVDCHLRWPSSLGKYAFVSSIVATSRLVSLTFLASDTPALSGGCPQSTSLGVNPSSSGSLGSMSSDIPKPPPLASQAVFTPLAAITLPREQVVVHRQYAVEGLVPGVGGWVVFGEGIEQPDFDARFATVQQTMLLPRCARAYTQLPIPNMAKQFNVQPLTGLVLIRGGNDIKVFKDTREIAGEERDALVIRLESDVGRNVLDDYKGPCGGRPESRTCNKPPVEQINSVAPDCDGNINLIFVSTSVAVGTPSNSQGGFVVDYTLGLEDACTRDDDLPKDGRLPNEYDDQCLLVSSASVSLPSQSLGSEGSAAPEPPVSESSEVPPVCAELPYTETFGDATADNFVVKAGAFSAAGGIYVPTQTGRRNASVWDDCAYSHVRDHICEVKLRLTKTGTPNGGMIIDWRTAGVPLREEYFLIELFKPTDSFRLRFYNGGAFITLADAQPVGIVHNREYTLRATLANSNPTTGIFEMYDGANLIATINLQTSDLSGNGGLFGVHAFRSSPEFTSFHVETN